MTTGDEDGNSPGSGIGPAAGPGAGSSTAASPAAADLAVRLEALEAAVVRIERRLDTIAAGGDAARAAGNPRPDRDSAVQGQGPPAASAAATRSLRRPTITLPSFDADPGQWANRLGIALVILGAAFGFKYSIDRGWIGPALRVACGLALGSLLLAASTRLRGHRSGLSRVLAGGGIATFYLTLFAACQLYGLVSSAVAFLLMSLVTLRAFALALRDDEATAALVGTIGGLATPFLLDTGDRSIGLVVGYTCLVVAGAGAVFLRGGWRALLWTATVGGWLVLASVAAQVGLSGDGMRVAEAGVLFHALATWWLSVFRETLSVEQPGRWPPTSAGFGHDAAARQARRGPSWPLQSHQLTLATPILVLALSAWIWRLEQDASGWLALTLAAGWSLAALRLRGIAGETTRQLAATHGVAACVMAAFATFLLLGDSTRLAGLAVEAFALVALARRSGDPRTAKLGHLLFAGLSLRTLQLLGDGIEAGARFRAGSLELAELVVVAALFAAGLVASPLARAPYLFTSQAGFLLWLMQMLLPLPNGTALVTAAWFANAVALVVAGLLRDAASLRAAGAAVMTLTMAKLFVYDLSTVGAGLRIASFLGFGLVLLGLGYAFPAIWKRDAPR